MLTAWSARLAVDNLKVVTSKTFKEVVLDSDKDVLVYVHLPSYSPPADLQVLAKAYAGSNDVIIAEYNRYRLLARVRSPYLRLAVV